MRMKPGIRNVHLEYTSSLLSSTCHVKVTKQLLSSAQKNQGNSVTLWYIVVDLTLIALSGLTKHSRADLGAFWDAHGEEATTLDEVPMEGVANQAISGNPECPCSSLLGAGC
jgi:hypothetical protein